MTPHQIRKLRSQALEIIKRKYAPDMTMELLLSNTQKRWVSYTRNVICMLWREKYPEAHDCVIASALRLSRCSVISLKTTRHDKLMANNDYADFYTELKYYFEHGKVAMNNSEPMIYDDKKKDKNLIANLCFGYSGGGTKTEIKLAHILNSNKSDYDKAIMLVEFSRSRNKNIRFDKLSVEVISHIFAFYQAQKYNLDIFEKSFIALPIECDEN